MATLAINGTLERGADVRMHNVMAVTALANIVKSSLGPVGLDKMIVDEVGDVTISNDGATILKQLEVENPAARVLVELSTLQDQEVGDGTTSVVILAAELLKVANELVKHGVHPTSVISGFNLAKIKACDFIAKKMSTKVETLGMEVFINAAKTSISSKIIGAESEHFARLAVAAVSNVRTVKDDGKIKYPIKAITILKAHGRSIRESELVAGYALNCQRASTAMPATIENAKIALLDIDLRKQKLGLGVSVVVSDPTKLEAIRAREGGITKERIDLLIAAGANVVLTTKGIDDMAIKHFADSKVMAVRRVDKRDLRNIAKATGGQIMLNLSDVDSEDGKDAVDVKMFGEAKLVKQSRVGDGELIYIQGCGNSKAQTIVLRGANDYMLDEVERSLHDALCAVKRTFESKTVVPGGGAVEAALSVHLEMEATKLASRDQLALIAYANALLVIPKTLAVNGAFDATDLVSKLRAYHYRSQTDEKKAAEKGAGLDLEEGKVRNNITAGVLEPSISKIKMIRFATEAAVTLLRIDDKIKMHPKDKPSGPVEDDY